MKRWRVNKEGWVFIAVGCIGLSATIPAGLLFKFSLIDILLVRDIVFAFPMAFDYGFILFGLWTLIEPIVFPERDTNARE
jgi:hypothetical protein